MVGTIHIASTQELTVNLRSTTNGDIKGWRGGGVAKPPRIKNCPLYRVKLRGKYLLVTLFVEAAREAPIGAFDM
jgi:hypothetical protein